MHKQRRVLELLTVCILTFTLKVNAQSAGRQFSLGFYKPVSDTNWRGYHSSIRDYAIQPTFDLPQDADTVKKRSWLHRKLFTEHLLEYNREDYQFYASFLPDLILGRSSANDNLWLNTRGFIAGGKLGKNFSFRTEFYENQGKFPRYLDAYSRAAHVVPGQGRARDFSSGKAFDYGYSSALLEYKAGKFLNFQLGYDKNFIGDGYRSMLLSDNAYNYPFLKITANVGRLHYTTMWAQFIDMMYPQSSYDNGFRKKWGIFNYLDWNISKKVSAGFFEAVIWQDSDSSGKRGFDMSYINPIMFLRPVEFSVGSPDNALLGFNLKYAPTTNSAIYGQLLLDEFKFKEITNGRGWWGNKFGGQIGFRSNNIFKVPELNFLTEINAARPYTYSQRTTLNNYGHSNQPLAHPLGANFVEWINIADYRYKRWFFRGELMIAKYGLDTAATNYGKDIFKSYDTRGSEFGNGIGQGLKTNLLYAQGTVAFLLNPKYNLRLELSAIGRQEKNALVTNREFIFSIGLRSTFRQLYYDF